MKTTGENFQMTSGSVQGVQEREQDIWKKVCEQLRDGHNFWYVRGRKTRL